MTTFVPTAHIECPGCRVSLTTDTPGLNQCRSCGWRGEIYMFQPTALGIDSGEIALPDEATCLHHPRKKATAICAGTGDYVCALCTVELNGKTYSAQYLEAGGKEQAAKAFERKLDRPDSKAAFYLATPFIPGLNYGTVAFAFILLPHGFVLLSRARRMRRDDSIYAQIVSPLRVGILTALMVIYSILWLGGVLALIYMLAFKDKRF